MTAPVAKKSLGQHFLADRRYLTPLLEAAALSPTDTVLEIGPGRGILTAALAKTAGCVVAVELDRRLIEPLQQQFADQPQVAVVCGDILELSPEALLAHSCPSRQARSPYKVVANLPYYITSAVLRHLLEAAEPPALAVLMVQWEVAQRICAAPGDLSLLAVSVQYYAEPSLVARVPASAFHPRPKVDSAIVRLQVRPQPAVESPAALFFAVVRAGFSQKRKQLHNSLAAGLQLEKWFVQKWLEAAGIDPARRAETLTLTEWGGLSQRLERTRQEQGEAQHPAPDRHPTPPRTKRLP
ncbi:MAG: 16S rRNA (adenine(1518)-N(6)/adenine(1519)-N(6))-dimethyltransferase RsmA [Caldilinea sp.]|jgi:16S rRNA (adenine1518-N6/adenine1519-N6)-dimethyltransferase